MATLKTAPGPRGLPFLGHVFARRSPLDLLQHLVDDYGDYVSLRFGPARYLFVNDPIGIKHVLVDNQKNYTRSPTIEGLRLILGDGLLTTDGAFWRRHRRLAQPAFHREKLALFSKAMVESTNDMIGSWSHRAGDRPFDVHDEMMQLTFKIVCRTLFSSDVSEDTRGIGRSILVSIRYATDYASKLVKVPTWVPTPKNLRFKRAIHTLDEMVLRIIDERRRSNVDSNDLLSMLMSARDEGTNQQLTDRELRDEVMTLAIAGHETTANALSWAFHLLSENPKICALVREEARHVLGERDPEVEDLPRLQLTRRIIDESIRLYPPIWLFERQASQADEIGEYGVEAGTSIVMSPYALHRNRRFWPNASHFDPDRFLPENANDRPKHAYLPFGAGPRICIGNAFAIMEAQIILSMVVRSFDLRPVAGIPVKPEPTITLRPHNGVKMTFRRAPEVSRELLSHAS
jgi:cytochrome P450